MAAARRGDFDEAASRLTRVNRERPTGRADDDEMGQEFAAISFVLAEDGERELAAKAAVRALAALGRVQGREGRREAIWAGLIEARIHELVLRDSARARRAYEQVSRRDPENTAASEGRARLDLAEAATEEKLKEQLLLEEAEKASGE